MSKVTAEADAPLNATALHEKMTELFRKNFCKNEDLLLAMSRIMMGVPTTEKEKGMLKAAFTDAELFEAVKKRFLPELSDAMMVGQAKDVWSDIDTDIGGKSRDQIEQFVVYKEKIIAMTTQAVELLRNPDGKAVDLSVTSDSLKADPLGTGIMARSNFIKNVNQQIVFLWIAGNSKKEEEPDDGKGKGKGTGRPLVRPEKK